MLEDSTGSRSTASADQGNTTTIGNCGSDSRSKQSKTRSNRRGLSEDTDRQLLQHIEEAGGIRFGKERGPISVSKLCYGRDHLCGEPNTPLREKVRQRVNFFYRLEKASYYRLLAAKGITPARTTAEQSRTMPSSSSSPSPSSSDSEEESRMSDFGLGYHSPPPSTTKRAAGSNSRSRSHKSRSAEFRSPRPNNLDFDLEKENEEDNTTPAPPNMKGKFFHVLFVLSILFGALTLFWCCHRDSGDPCKP